MTYPPYQHAPAPAPAPARPARRGGPTTWFLGSAMVCVGLMAGLFFAFTVSVMPGLAAGDDRTYVTAMQHINDKIENGLFGLVFTGALLFTAVAAVLLLVRRQRGAAVWAGAAVLCYLLVLALTMGVEIPLNNELAAAGPADRIPDLAGVRHDFESVWVPVNDARTALCVLALVCLAPALHLHGRGTPRP